MHPLYEYGVEVKYSLEWGNGVTETIKVKNRTAAVAVMELVQRDITIGRVTAARYVKRQIGEWEDA